MIHDSTNFLLTIAQNIDNCEDEIVATIFVNNGVATFNNSQILRKAKKSNLNNSFSRTAINYLNYQSNHQKIVLILESPSVSEFNCLKTKRNSPAYGLTGGKINSHLINLIINSIANGFLILSSGQYELIIVNAIRYQCNLGNNKNKKMKKMVFEHLWNNMSFDIDLKDRLQFLKPSVVLIAVTNEVSKLVNKTIINNWNVGNVILESGHPVSWTQNSCFK